MTNPGRDELVGVWDVVQMPDAQGSVSPLLDGSRVLVDFDPGGTVSGNAGCNVFRGVFAVDGDSIGFDRMATTQRLCARPSGVMEQERRFLDAMRRITRFSIDEGILLLHDETSRPVIRMQVDGAPSS